MGEWMEDGWAKGWKMDGCEYRRVDKWARGWTDRWMGEWKDR
jgi:hypothetical protein